MKGFADWSPEKVGGLQSLTFWTEDAAGTAEELRQAGVEVSQDPRPQPWGMTEVRFKDGDGNEYLLYGPGKASVALAAAAAGTSVPLEPPRSPVRVAMAG